MGDTRNAGEVPALLEVANKFFIVPQNRRLNANDHAQVASGCPPNSPPIFELGLSLGGRVSGYLATMAPRLVELHRVLKSKRPCAFGLNVLQLQKVKKF